MTTKTRSQLGEWILIPSSRRIGGRRTDAYMEREGERVRLRYCSSVLEELVGTIGRIEADFTHRCETGTGTVTVRPVARS